MVAYVELNCVLTLIGFLLPLSSRISKIRYIRAGNYQARVFDVLDKFIRACLLTRKLVSLPGSKLSYGHRSVCISGGLKCHSSSSALHSMQNEMVQKCLGSKYV